MSRLVTIAQTITLTAILAAIALVSGYAVGGGNLAAIFGPDCPQEDSCTIDYRDGAWHITEVAP